MAVGSKYLYHICCKWFLARSYWTFIVWGLFHAFLFLPLLLRGKNRRHNDTIAENSILPSIRESLVITNGFDFVLVVLGWIFFRAANVRMAFEIIANIFLTHSLVYQNIRLECLKRFLLYVCLC